MLRQQWAWNWLFWQASDGWCYLVQSQFYKMDMSQRQVAYANLAAISYNSLHRKANVANIIGEGGVAHQVGCSKVPKKPYPPWIHTCMKCSHKMVTEHDIILSMFSSLGTITMHSFVTFSSELVMWQWSPIMPLHVAWLAQHANSPCFEQPMALLAHLQDSRQCHSICCGVWLLSTCTIISQLSTLWAWHHMFNSKVCATSTI